MLPMNSLVIATLLGGTFLMAVYKLQFFLIYPSSFPEGSRESVDKPDEYGMPFEDVTLLTPDGENIHVYVIPSKLGTKASRTVLFLGPNAGNMGNSLPLAKLVHEFGHNVVMLSYRGYGKSTGSPSERGLKIDVDTVLKFISDHSKLAGTKLVLYGRSLGGAVAIYSAVNAPPGLISGVVLENTFLSIPKVAPAVVSIAKYATPLITERWESEKLIDKISPDLPMMFMAGGQDELIPPAMFRKLFQLCSSLRKTFNLYPRGTHNDTALQQGYWEDMEAFISSI